MKEKEIVFFQVYELDAEISEILKVSKDVVKNYWLTLLHETVLEEKAKLEKVKEGLIQKYGNPIEKDGQSGIELQPKIKDDNGNEIDNPKFVDYINEWFGFLNNKKTIEYTPIKLSTLEGIQLEKVPVTLYKFITPE